ncbi:MAG: hypothetical protein HY708_00310 [Ignavibacteriae bacterium]|nr:hypothetical protein [Ignavibacteriota bacterium]
MNRKLTEHTAINFVEKDEVLELKDLLAEKGDPQPSSPPDSYWGNLIVRTNQRIDEATSGKALSINWAARVAIPGVIAILSFLFGLQYYVPDGPSTATTLNTVVQSLPEETIDSLLAQVPQIMENYTFHLYANDPFVVSDDQIVDYFVAMGKASTLLDVMTDQQVEQLLTQLALEKKL